MKLNSVMECIGVTDEVKIFEGKEVKYHGSAIGFYEEKFPKFFKSRDVLRFSARNGILEIRVSETPAFAGGKMENIKNK